MAIKFFSKRLLKILLIVIALLILIPGVSVASYRGVNHYQANQLQNEAQSFIGVEKYDEAIEKLALARTKWISNNLKNEIETNLQSATISKENRGYFEKGVAYYDEEKYEDAKGMFEKVSNTSKYFDESQEKLKVINERIAEEIRKAEEATKAKVKSVTTTAPAQTSAPVAQPTANPNKDSICRNEAEIYKIQQKDAAMAQLKREAPELFYTDADWRARGYSDADLQYIKPYYQNAYNQGMITIDNALQQTYLQKYNECLQK